MILSDKEIRKALIEDQIRVSPSISELQLQSASIDLRLGDNFLKIQANDQIPLSAFPSIDFFSEKGMRYCERHGLSYIDSKGFLLGTTVEKISLPSHIGAMVSGRSSIGRAGLVVENAGWIDPGFEGQITLELFNMTNYPIKLPIGARICQIIFYRLGDFCERPYGSRELGSKYQGQLDVEGSRIAEERNE